jgi:hypothetical protein
MLIATTQSKEGHKVLILGLSQRNIELLQQGRPIHKDGSEAGLDSDVLILYGKTDEDLVRELTPLIGPDTRITRRPENPMNQTNKHERN